jgi:hypothetical protein
LLGTILAITAIAIYSCAKSDNTTRVNNNTAEKRTVDPNLYKSFKLPFPEGTTFNFNGNELQFVLPKPYYILGKGVDGNFYRSVAGGGGGVTCTCTKGSGCDPIKSGSDYGCLMKDGCTSCDKSAASIAGINVELTEIVILNPESSIGVDRFSQLDGKLLLPKDFIESEDISNLIHGLNSNMVQSTSSEKKVVFLNAYGYILPVEVPTDMDNTSISFIAAGGGGTGVSCSCNIAGKECPKESKWGVVWCNSNNCTSCTMSGIVADDHGIQKSFKVNAGVITLN